MIERWGMKPVNGSRAFDQYVLKDLSRNADNNSGTEIKGDLIIGNATSTGASTSHLANNSIIN